MCTQTGFKAKISALILPATGFNVNFFNFKHNMWNLNLPAFRAGKRGVNRINHFHSLNSRVMPRARNITKMLQRECNDHEPE